MKLLFLPALLTILFAIAAPKAIAQHCAADPQRYPEFAQQRAQAEAEMEAWLQNNSQALLSRNLITIPVVVHVVYQTAPQNISQEQIQSQIEVLNADYRAQNDNLSIVPQIFQNLIADLEIEFCLAKSDPEGNFTTGITRTLTTKDDIGLSSDVHYASEGGAGGWDPGRYLNIWVADMGENVVGRASFPGAGPAAEDGVVIDPRYFGTTGLAAGSFPYNEGRTVVHEIGHYFNLYHPWGTGTPTCDADDEVADTPLTSNNYLGECPQSLQASCGSLDMYTNFMYYTDDACMAQFTPGQKLRVLACLNGPRAGLLESMGCQPSDTAPQPLPSLVFSIQPNPSSGQVVIACEGPEGATCHIQVFDAMGRQLCALDIPANQPYTWPVPLSFVDGMYWVRGEMGGKVFTMRLVISR
ncbi:MAG: M43 family zinc metalloprotease [Saprospiraceae bacterium]